GQATAWNPGADNTVVFITVDGPTVFAGGAHSYMGGRPQAGISRITASPAIIAITPAAGGNTGSIGVSLVGGGLGPGTTVKLLKAAHPPINATNVTLTQDALSLSATFNLAGADTGAWDVVVTTWDQQTATLTNGFQVTGIEAPELRVSIVGPSLVAGVPSI